MAELKFLGVVEVDSGTLVIGDPLYLLPNAESGKPGVDYQAVIDADARETALPFGNGFTLLLQNFGGDGTFPVYGEFDEGDLSRVVVDLSGGPEDEDEDAAEDG